MRSSASASASASAITIGIGVSAVALLGCGGLRAPLTCPQKGGPAWVELRSDPFTLRSDLPPDDAREVLKELEQSYQAFVKLAFRSQSSPADQIDVVVFDRSADYEEVAPEKTVGFFAYIDLDSRPTIVLKSGFSHSVRSIVQHELTHRFVGYFMPRAPTWLNEGLAEFYETMRFEDGEAILGEVSPNWAFYHPAIGSTRRGINIDDLPSASELLATTPETFYDPERAALRYAGAWFFVSMLINGPEEYQRRFWAFAHGLSDGTPAEVAWRAAFAGVSSEALDQELRHYVLDGKTVLRRAPFEPKRLASSAVTPMSDADVHVLWAKLLMRRGDEGVKRASDHLAEALRQAPALADAHHWRGMVALAEEKYGEAQEEFRAAVSESPREPRYLHGLAAAIFREEQAQPPGERDLTNLREVMQKLAQVARSSSSLNSLGWFYAAMGKTDEGLPFAKRAVEAEPGCWECLDTLALLASQKGWAREALDLQQRALALVPHSKPAPKDAVARLHRYEAEAQAEVGAAKGTAAGEAAQSAAETPEPSEAKDARPAQRPVVLAFDSSQMSRPAMISGKDPAYTREAIEACVEGLMIVRCRITTEGRIRQCRAIKTLPHMEAPLIDALESRRYTPATLQGQPVAVDYVFNVRLVLPAPCGSKPPPSARKLP